MTTRPLLLLTISLFIGSQLYSQSGKDSILHALQTAKEDTGRINLLYMAQRIYLNEDIDSSLYYNQQEEKLIDKLGATSFRHRCYHEFVRIYHAMADYKNALRYCLRSLEVAKSSNNRFQEATSYRAIFNIYHNLRMNDSAVKYALYSAKLTEEIHDTANLSSNLGNMAWLYVDLNQYDKAIEYGKRGIDAGERYKDTAGMLAAINNVGLCYSRMGKDREAIPFFKRQIAVAKIIKRRRSIERGLINLATSYYALEDAVGLDSAVKALNAHLAESKTIDPKIKALQYIANGQNLILHRQLRAAEDTFLMAMDLARRDSLTDVLFTVYSTMSSLRSASHDFKMADYYDTQYDSLSEYFRKQELAEYELDLRTKYETEKKDNQLKLQEARIRQKDTLTYILIGSATALLVITFLSYRNYRQKQRLQQQRISELEKENQLTAAEAVLKGEEQERSRLAKDLHDGLGGMLSGIKYSLNAVKNNLVMTPDNLQSFERSVDMLDSSIREMRRVAHNMMPEALVKFGLDTALKDFCNDINQSGALKVNYQSIGLNDAPVEQSISITIYRTIQELINNIIRHAHAQTAIVQVSRSENSITIAVEDDGKGFDPAILKKAGGMGWNNIRSRVEYLKGTLDVKTAPGESTSVLIELKS